MRGLHQTWKFPGRHFFQGCFCPTHFPRPQFNGRHAAGAAPCSLMCFLCELFSLWVPAGALCSVSRLAAVSPTLTPLRFHQPLWFPALSVLLGFSQYFLKYVSSQHTSCFDFLVCWSNLCVCSGFDWAGFALHCESSFLDLCVFGHLTLDIRHCEITSWGICICGTVSILALGSAKLLGNDPVILGFAFQVCEVVQGALSLRLASPPVWGQC